MGQIFDKLDDAISADGVVDGDYPVNLYPSEAGASVGGITYGKCMRAAFLRYKGAVGSQVYGVDGELITVTQEKIGPRVQWIFKAGNMFESALIEQAKIARIFVDGHTKFTVPVGWDYQVRGELDAIFEDKQGNNVGIEIKSVSGNHAESAIMGTPGMRRRGIKGEPKDDHLMQTAIYAWRFRKQLPAFYILYIMRDKCLREEFKVEVKEDTEGRRIIYVDGSRWTKFTYDDIWSRYKDLAYSLHKNKLPPRDYDLIFNDEKMNELLANNKLARGDTANWTKYWEREQDHAQGKKVRRVKRPTKGDWQCSYCSFQGMCYDNAGQPWEEVVPPPSLKDVLSDELDDTSCPEEELSDAGT